MTTQEYITYKLSQGASVEEIKKVVQKIEGEKKASEAILNSINPFKNLFS